MMRSISPKQFADGQQPEIHPAAVFRQKRLIVAMTFSTEDQRADCCRPPSDGDTVTSVRIIHFGADDCHRINVLRSAGYSVEDCRSLGAFHEALAEREPAAVFVTEGDDGLPWEAVSLVKSFSAAPLVLFRRSHGDLAPESFDLAIESLTPPRQWLLAIGDLIARCGSAPAGGRALDAGNGRMRWTPDLDA
jgi:hypothetical protein